jgi:hypothetical protein
MAGVSSSSLEQVRKGEDDREPRERYKEHCRSLEANMHLSRWQRLLAKAN